MNWISWCDEPFAVEENNRERHERILARRCRMSRGEAQSAPNSRLAAGGMRGISNNECEEVEEAIMSKKAFDKIATGLADAIARSNLRPPDIADFED
jgi:hypothetical protein